MSSKNDSNWYQNYEALKAYILERGHLPDKHVVEKRALCYHGTRGRRSKKEIWMQRSENCLIHYSQLVRMNILREEGRMNKE